MYRFTRRLAVVTMALVCAAGAADTIRRMRDEAPAGKPSAGVAPADADAPVPMKKAFALANVGSGSDQPLTEADLDEALRRSSEVYIAEWLKQQRQDLRAQGRDVPAISSTVNYERIGGRKFMVTHLRTDDRHGAAIAGIVKGEPRMAWCATEDGSATPLASRECARAIEETFGVKTGR